MFIVYRDRDKRALLGGVYQLFSEVSASVQGGREGGEEGGREGGGQNIMAFRGENMTFFRQNITFFSENIIFFQISYNS